MMRIAAILLSTLILVQSFNVHFNDIFELDELIEHAQFHAEEYGDNFLVFISKHYGELKAEHNKNHQEEKEEHERLPFQQQSQSIVLYAFATNELQKNLPEIIFESSQDSNFFYQASYYSLNPEGPFQPPRQV